MSKDHHPIMASDATAKKDEKKSLNWKKILMWSGIGALVLLALLVLYFRFIKSSASAPPAVADA
jgi:uncharacterized membrane protein YvbJ